MNRLVFSVFYVFPWETWVTLLFCVLFIWNGFCFLWNCYARQFIFFKLSCWLQRPVVGVLVMLRGPSSFLSSTPNSPVGSPDATWDTSVLCFPCQRAFNDAPTLSFPWFKGFWCLFCSWPVGWKLVCRDVSPGASVWMSLCGAGLLEGKDCGGRACHHPWIHHDNRNILQGRVKETAIRQLGDLVP